MEGKKRPRYVTIAPSSAGGVEGVSVEPAPHTPLWLYFKMVLGGGSEGGRYGSVGESGGLMGEFQYCGSGGNSRSGTSSSSSSVVDEADHCHMTHDVYQRQPLLANHDSYINANGVSKDGSGSGMVKIPIPTPHRDEPRFPKEKFKTLLAFLFLFSNWILTTASLALTHERVPNYKPLPDVTLDAITPQDWGLDVSEIIIMISMYLCVMVLLFHKHRWILFRRVFLMMGLLYFYRSITMYVTVLPVANPNYPCAPKANYTSPVLVAKRVIQLLSGFGLSINGKHTFCGDYIYSGHTVCLVLAYLVVREYTPRRWWLLHWCFALLAVTGVVMVLIARGHYTVDCIIAYYITTRIFYIYHTLANNANLKESGPNNFFERLWWYPLFWRFERNVQGVVPRHYEWPLPWPRRWSSKNPQRTS
ncbi:phosphatidylcholine:ceramide cholinephosphotransferase 2-like isoform X2 [Eriocheir sinensis]|uniref:phosphatidylcholine:ceramide cholinephosphotransferase 2-like isoform X2 n=1 Tax=Eriocheir sinensis TaxID=95602 RepID=UPI0021C61325|nr:phosphatidylcholine:ceramide cholinephosphotransferase 2-like isoform X2 [Eriocheir sinensis]